MLYEKSRIDNLEKDIKEWIKNFQETQPDNVEVDTETFEGSAYYLLATALVTIKELA